jgi:hypothetical protein
VIVVQRVALEDHRDVAVLGCLVVHDLPADAHLARGDVLQAGDHVQRRRLPAARRADQDDEFPVGDIQVEVVDRERSVRKTLGDVLKHDFGHLSLLKLR